MKKTKIIVVVGPTASGKTALGIHLAQKFGGEVVSGDSMQIYENMDIATAKPTKEEMQGVKHHLIGFVKPENEYSVASFCLDAKKAVEEIEAKGKIPVLVGGTGLYIDSFINNITFFDNANSKAVREKLYEELNEFGVEKLYNELLSVDSEAAKKIHPNNEVRVIRALEIYRLTGETLTEQNKRSRDNESIYDPVYIGIAYKDREKLYKRINTRVDLMLEAGLLEETREFYKKYPSQTAVNAIGYKELKPFIDGEKSLDECVEHLKQSTRRYAKRQLTWFNKNEKINWVYPDLYSNSEELFNEAERLVEKFLKGE
ncbi:MAG: tRNA (adenosine(37)-N6)-dimethylallyltransferase MiaA [Ruminococcaceae bacterium]|nr:tRNA (adenosine(37)-N6)-dimethylallyltransferase MiaA [Oscillospiraceae bacterium]